MNLLFSLEKKIKNNLICLFFSFHIFFWDIKIYGNYGFRELIVLTLFVLAYDLSKNNFYLLKKSIIDIFLIFILISILFLHLYVNSKIDNQVFNQNSLLGILGSLILLLLVFFYYNLIIKYFHNILIIFLIVFLLSYFFSNFAETTKWENENLCLAPYNAKNLFIFKENSHIGMMAGSIIGYLLYYFKDKGYKSLVLIYLFLIFLLYFESSTTLYFSLFVSMFLLFFFDTKSFIKVQLVPILLIVVVFTIVNQSNSCFFKAKQTINAAQNLLNKNSNENAIYNIGPVLLKKKPDIKNEKVSSSTKKIDVDFAPTKDSKIRFNLSSAVFINSLEISYASLNQKPLGWGLNRYENAFYFYMGNHHVVPYLYREVYTLNYNDGSANISKLLTEFGYLTFLFCPIFIIFLFTKKIPTELKIFLASIILTQLIRGAGYFNGSFMFCALIIIFTVFKSFSIKNDNKYN